MSGAGGPVQRSTEKTLGDIGRVARSAALIVERGKPAYDRDELLQLAAEAVVSRLGEAASRLPDGFRGKHPDVPWREIRGVRNLVAHEYQRIDTEILWQIVAVDIPSVAAALGVSP